VNIKLRTYEGTALLIYSAHYVLKVKMGVKLCWITISKLQQWHH